MRIIILKRRKCQVRDIKRAQSATRQENSDITYWQSKEGGEVTSESIPNSRMSWATVSRKHVNESKTTKRSVIISHFVTTEWTRPTRWSVAAAISQIYAGLSTPKVA